MTKSRTTLWPRPYILAIHEKAITEGCCRVEGLDEQRAKSLVASFYRIRRRGDSAHKLHFIKPEYHLVEAMFEPERQSVLFVYNSLPDNMNLPELCSVPDAEKQLVAQSQGPVPLVPELLDIDDLINESMLNIREGSSLD